VTRYAYDNAGQVLSIIATRTSDGVVISSEAYTYDAAGDRTSMTDNEGTHVYGYDNLHRLTSATHPAGSVLPVKNETFGYDSVGNRLADAAIGGYTCNSANELTSNSSFTYTYDADGSLASKTDTASNQTTYSFDSQNELTALALNGANWTYQYDANGRRVEKSSGTLEGQKIRYVYDGRNILAMLDTTNNPVITFTDGPILDEALSIHKIDADYFIHRGSLGSVRIHTDAVGVAVEYIKYQVYGNPILMDIRGDASGYREIGSFTGNPFAFTK
jgi:YD repeat-containing protein